MKQTQNTHAKKYGFWNWGTGITITFIIAASLMLFLVYKTTTVNFDLAEDNYYEQEMKFNNQLLASGNVRSLSAGIKINQDDSFIKITVPGECIEQHAKGTLWIYRPSSEKNDLHLDMNPDKNGDIFINKNNLITGVYKLKADWQMSGKDYHQELSFFVEK